MWLQAPFDIEVQRNASVPIGFQLLDDLTETPIDITGWTFEMSCSMVAGISPFTSFPVVIRDPLYGLFEVSVGGGGFGLVSGDQETARVAYDILATANSETVVALRGTIILKPGVTQ